MIERKTLVHILPTWHDVVLNFFKPIELKEPTFKNVIILYRKEGNDGVEGVSIQDYSIKICFIML